MDEAKKEEVKKAICFGIGKFQKSILGIPDGETDKPHSRGIKITKDGYAIATDTRMVVKIPLNDFDADELNGLFDTWQEIVSVIYFLPLIEGGIFIGANKPQSKLKKFNRFSINQLKWGFFINGMNNNV